MSRGAVCDLRRDKVKGHPGEKMAFGFSIQMAVPVKGSHLCHPQANFHRLTVRVLCGRSIDIVVRYFR
jgi:hypothetical protein